jgi:hypothetical protein
MKDGKRKLNSRGLSDIVVTLIIVLLSMVAIGVVWAVVNNLLQSGTEQTTTGFEQLSLNFELQKVLVEPDGDLQVVVKRNVGSGTISGLKFIISDGTNSELISRETTLDELESQSFIINYSEISDLSFVQEVSIAPIVGSDYAKGTTGNVADSEEMEINLLSFITTHSGTVFNKYTYWLIYDNASYTIVSGDYLEYDIYCENLNVACREGIEIEGISPVWSGRGLSLVDQNGISVTGEIANYAKGKWYHRKFSLTPAVGKIIKEVSVIEESDYNTTYSSLYGNLKITNLGTTKIIFYNIYEGKLNSNVINYGSGSSNSSVSIIKE